MTTTPAPAIAPRLPLITASLALLWLVARALYAWAVPQPDNALALAEALQSQQLAYTFLALLAVLLHVCMVVLFLVLARGVLGKYGRGGITSALCTLLFALTSVPAHFSQVIMPLVAAAISGGEAFGRTDNLARLTLDWPGSGAGLVVGISYALLGIPALLIGLKLWRTGNQPSGALLMAGTVLACTALVGTIAGYAAIDEPVKELAAYDPPILATLKALTPLTLLVWAGAWLFLAAHPPARADDQPPA